MVFQKFGEVSVSMKCPACGFENLDEAANCQQCGYELDPFSGGTEAKGWGAAPPQLKPQEYKFSFMDLLIGRPGTTDVGLVTTGLAGLLLTLVFYLVAPLPQLKGSYFYAVFAERGRIPYAIAFFFFWTLAILVHKLAKVLSQKSAFKVQLIPAGIKKITLQMWTISWAAFCAPSTTPGRRYFPTGSGSL